MIDSLNDKEEEGLDPNCLFQRLNDCTTYNDIESEKESIQSKDSFQYNNLLGA